jgi:hypothetical protein
MLPQIVPGGISYKQTFLNSSVFTTSILNEELSLDKYGSVMKLKTSVGSGNILYVSELYVFSYSASSNKLIILYKLRQQ